MDYRIIDCDSLLRKITLKDELFNGNYCIDPYQNCEFGCLYCDSSYNKTIYIKNNSAEILKNELKNAKQGKIIIGSVHDPYQIAEKKFEITKKILKIIKNYNFPCHILTKSKLILRDINLISSLDCNVTISIISLDKNITNIFEKNVPLTNERFQIIKKLQIHKINSGIALIPYLPYIIDEELENIIKTSNDFNAGYFLFKHLELKGEQKLYFLDLIKKYFPQFLSKYNNIYKNNIKPDNEYLSSINSKIKSLCKKYKIQNKMHNI